MVGLLELTEGLPVRTLEDDEVLIAQGGVPGPLFVLESGTIVVERDGTAFASVDTPGAVFGEMGAVLEQPATATCRAQGPCRLRTADDPIAFLTDNPGAALAALRIAATRLDNLTRYLGDVKRQYEEMTGHMGMVDDVLHVLVHHQPRPVQSGSARDAELDY